MKNINLIRKIAWSFHATTGLDSDDLFQEAALAYLEGLKNYDPAKGKITTYMWHSITSHLTNYLKKYERWDSPVCYLEDFIDLDIAIPIDEHEDFIDWKLFLKDAQIVVDEILRSPCKYSILSSAEAKQIITRRMYRSARHWSWKRIRKVMKDLELIFG